MIFVREIGLSHCKAACSTLTYEVEYKIGDGCQLSESEGRPVRRSTARVNFLSQDRFDLCCAARMLSKYMSQPTVGTIHALMHVVKYSKGHVRCVNKFNASIPDEDYKVTVHCGDSDWAHDDVSIVAGCCGVLTRVTFLGAKRRPNNAVSSGEAAFNSSLKGIRENTGVINLGEELMKCQLRATVRGEACACAEVGVVSCGCVPAAHVEEKPFRHLRRHAHPLLDHGTCLLEKFAVFLS